MKDKNKVKEIIENIEPKKEALKIMKEIALYLNVQYVYGVIDSSDNECMAIFFSKKEAYIEADKNGFKVDTITIG